MHGPGAVLVGQDKYGNKYYERMSEQFGELRQYLDLAIMACSEGVRLQVAIDGLCTLTWTGLPGRTPPPYLQSGTVLYSSRVQPQW